MSQSVQAAVLVLGLCLPSGVPDGELSSPDCTLEEVGQEEVRPAAQELPRQMWTHQAFFLHDGIKSGSSWGLQGAIGFSYDVRAGTELRSNQTAAGRSVHRSFPALTPTPTTLNPAQSCFLNAFESASFPSLVPCPYPEANDFHPHYCISHLTELLASGFTFLSTHTAFGENFPEHAYNSAAAFRMKI